MGATLTPRLRVDNGVRLWKYSGDLLPEGTCGFREPDYEASGKPGEYSASGKKPGELFGAQARIDRTC